MHLCRQSDIDQQSPLRPNIGTGVVSSLQNVLSEFQSHELEETDSLSLMNRFDTKYLLPQDSLPEFLRQLQDDYSVLSINGKRQMRYRNIYYDTPEFVLYNQHHNKRKTRFKVRCRTYLDSATSFLEIKNKNNKDMTDKHRVRVGELQICERIIPSLLQDFGMTPLSFDQLYAQVGVYYERISLQSTRFQERVSVDLALQANPVGSRRNFRLTGLAIVELKQNRLNRESPVYKSMKINHCRPLAFSKYCIACASLFPNTIKTNIFKPILSRFAAQIEVSNGASIHV